MRSTTHCLLIENIKDLRYWQEGSQAGCKLALVPTMGALHQGHMRLINQAVKECDKVIVSIFVNPLQFGPNEDFERYPRTLDKDLELCSQAGVTAVFHPSLEEMYPGTTSSMVVPPESLTDRLCGKFRPGHFSGVATVVLKLFNLVRPQKAYLGEKDFQQLTIIKKMVKDLNVPVEIVSVPIAREKDGLACSSRNAYLTFNQRQAAPALYKTLCRISLCLQQGHMSLAQALDSGGKELSVMPGLKLQYLEACNPTTLEPLMEAKYPLVLLVAAKLGEVRLIDNLIVART